MRCTLAAVVALPLVLSGAARADTQTWRVASNEVSYRLVHKLHRVVGKTLAAEAVAAIDDAGAKVMVRIPVKSFDSGNANRDAHMLEVVDGARYPYVVLKGYVPAEALRAAGARGKLELEAELDFHGVKARRMIALEIARPSAKQLYARFRFPVSLTKHKVERPSLLFIKVDDEITISGSFRLEPK